MKLYYVSGNLHLFGLEYPGCHYVCNVIKNRVFCNYQQFCVCLLVFAFPSKM